MRSLKEKMYNYEVIPPAENWQRISTALDEINQTNAHPLKKSNGFFYMGVAAAVVAIIICSIVIWLDNSGNRVNIVARSVNSNVNDRSISGSISKEKITVPEGDKGDLSSQPGNGNYNKETDQGEVESYTKKYITISGPQGQPVRISAKVASLIVSSDDQYPPNAVWSDKVKKWKDIMKAQILAPTTTNFLDIVELTHAVNTNNPNP